MAYRISYDTGTATKTVIHKQPLRFSVLVGTGLLLFALLTHWFWPSGAERLRSLLIPGDPAVTTAAFSGLLDDLREGESLPDAAQSFCREILHEAGYPD